MAAVPYRPEGYHTVTPYLIVEKADAELEFIQRAFGAALVHCNRMPDGTIAHADLTIGDSHVMLGQAGGQWAPMTGSIYLYVEDTDATYRRALDAGATSIMEPADQFYGDRNAGVKDANGVAWWIGTHFEDVSPEEMERRSEKAMRERAERG